LAWIDPTRTPGGANNYRSNCYLPLSSIKIGYFRFNYMPFVISDIIINDFRKEILCRNSQNYFNVYSTF